MADGPKRKRKLGLELKMTDRCNQRCRHCMNADGGHGGADLHPRWILEQLSDWARRQRDPDWVLSEVRMTGGEPLLCMPAVRSIAAACRARKIKSGINTNGTLLTREAARRLKDAGLGVVKVSFDTLDPQTYARIRGAGADLAANLAGIRTAVVEGFEVVLRFTLETLNQHDLVPCYRFANQLGVDGFQVKPMVPVGRAARSGLLLDRLPVTRALEALASAVVENGTGVQVLCWPPEQAAGLPGKACGSVNKLYIAPDGEITRCNYVPDSRSFGNVSRDALVDLLDDLDASLSVVLGHEVLVGCPQWAALSEGVACPASAPSATS